ncbi:expressed unknown protein [Seminavis robusta]|uniref:Uncharacterized protein n=1 Tax=Seminavis robusta TaxID=568900 RepID=A0A9N8EWY0_9STRA|nr:expressed unknown protein [Seminavis robusta]|eukprot:Sro1847_g301420.1 n/a (400) ;mRNA; r:8722-9921
MISTILPTMSMSMTAVTSSMFSLVIAAVANSFVVLAVLVMFLFVRRASRRSELDNDMFMFADDASEIFDHETSFYASVSQEPVAIKPARTVIKPVIFKKHLSVPPISECVVGRKSSNKTVNSFAASCDGIKTPSGQAHTVVVSGDAWLRQMEDAKLNKKKLSYQPVTDLPFKVVQKQEPVVVDATADLVPNETEEPIVTTSAPQQKKEDAPQVAAVIPESTQVPDAVILLPPPVDNSPVAGEPMDTSAEDLVDIVEKQPQSEVSPMTGTLPTTDDEVMQAVPDCVKTVKPLPCVADDMIDTLPITDDEVMQSPLTASFEKPEPMAEEEDTNVKALREFFHQWTLQEDEKMGVPDSVDLLCIAFEQLTIHGKEDSVDGLTLCRGNDKVRDTITEEDLKDL